MGLVKGKTESPAGSRRPARPAFEQLAADLESSQADLRRKAAREIARCPGAARVLVDRLQREEHLAVREAILLSLSCLNDPAVVHGLVECLRSQDPSLRNEALETLQMLSTDLSTALTTLLADADPDVRIFAVKILESRRNPDVEKWLIQVIEADRHVNVCATAVDLLCEVGTDLAVEPLLRLKARFPAEPYIQFAADLALKRIREV